MSALRQWIGSVLFTGWMFGSVGFYAIAVIVIAPFGSAARYGIAKAWARLMMRSLNMLCGIDYRVRGAENIPNEAAVFLLKHSSALETIAEIEIFPRQTWVLKRELQWVPIFGWALRLLDPIAINRGGRRSAVKQVIKQGKAQLENGVNVMIFPEGTRVPHGQSRRYGSSGVALAKAADVPVIPVAHNAGVFWARRGVRKFSGTVEFVIGEPVWVEDRDVRKVNEDIQQWMESEIDKMGGRELRSP
ncbi:MAG: lysophospholipid acyltransferase family protein [Pseudomonadota bacterium]